MVSTFLKRIYILKIKGFNLKNYENLIIFLLSLMFISILNLPVWKDYMHSEDLYALGLYSYNNNNLLTTIFSPFGDLFFRSSDLLWGITLESLFNGNPNTLRIFNLLLTCFTIVLFNIILKKFKINTKARILGIIFFILSKVHFTTIGYLSAYEVMVTTIHQELTLLFLIIGIGYKNKAWRIKRKYYLLSLFFFFITVLSRDASFLFIITITVFIYVASYQYRNRIKKIFLLTAPFFTIILLYFVLRYLTIGPQGFGIGNNNYYSININPKDILNKLWIFIGNTFNLPFGYKESFGIGSAFSLLIKMGVRPVLIRILDYSFLCFGILGILLIFVKGVKNKKIILLPFSWLLASFIPLLLIPTYRIYYLYSSFIGVAFIISFILNQVKFNKLFLTITVTILIINFLNLLVHNHWSTYYTLTYRWSYKVAENGINEIVSQNERGKINSITIISSNTELMNYIFNASYDNIFLKKVINPGVKLIIVKDKSALPTNISDLNPVYIFNSDLTFSKVKY